MTLKDFFIKYPKIAIAFSGGTDSAYLCYMAKKYAKEMTAIYVSTAFQPTFEKEDAIRFCKEYAIPLTILNLRKNHFFAIIAAICRILYNSLLT